MSNPKAEPQIKGTSFSTLVVVFFAISGLISYLDSGSSLWLRALCAGAGTFLLNLEVCYEQAKRLKAAHGS